MRTVDSVRIARESELVPPPSGREFDLRLLADLRDWSDTRVMAVACGIVCVFAAWVLIQPLPPLAGPLSLPWVLDWAFVVAVLVTQAVFASFFFVTGFFKLRRPASRVAVSPEGLRLTYEAPEYRFGPEGMEIVFRVLHSSFLPWRSRPIVLLARFEPDGSLRQAAYLALRWQPRTWLTPEVYTALKEEARASGVPMIEREVPSRWFNPWSFKLVKTVIG